MGRSGNRLSNIRGSYSCTDYAIKEDQEGMVQEEQDIIDRYYFSRYGRNDLNLIRYGERSCFSTLNQELAWGREQNKDLLLYFPFHDAQ